MQLKSDREKRGVVEYSDGGPLLLARINEGGFRIAWENDPNPALVAAKKRPQRVSGDVRSARRYPRAHKRENFQSHPYALERCRRHNDSALFW